VLPNWRASFSILSENAFPRVLEILGFRGNGNGSLATGDGFAAAKANSFNGRCPGMLNCERTCISIRCLLKTACQKNEQQTSPPFN